MTDDDAEHNDGEEGGKELKQKKSKPSFVGRLKKRQKKEKCVSNIEERTNTISTSLEGSSWGRKREQRDCVRERGNAVKRSTDSKKNVERNNLITFGGKKTQFSRQQLVPKILSLQTNQGILPDLNRIRRTKRMFLKIVCSTHRKQIRNGEKYKKKR